MSRYRWTILALGTAAQWSYSAVFLGIPVLAPQLRDEYGLSLTQVGVVLAAFSIGSVVTLLPWGLLSDRVGERGVLAAGLTRRARQSRPPRSRPSTSRSSSCSSSAEGPEPA